MVVDPAGVDAFEKAGVELLETGGGVEKFVEVGRSSYLNNPDYVLRRHPFVTLASVPTLIVAVAKAPADAEDEPGIDVIERTENPTAEWVRKLP